MEENFRRHNLREAEAMIRPGEINIQTFNTPEAAEHYTRLEISEIEVSIFKRHLSKPGRLIDLGCGTGRTTSWLHRLGHKVIGLDTAPAMIMKARELPQEIDFLVGDAAAMGFKENSFDCALFSFNGIDCIFPKSRRLGCLLEVNRILKDSGTFILSSHNEIWRQKYHGRSKRYEPPYYIHHLPYGPLLTYYITPKEQNAQLRATGYKPLREYGGHNEPWIYYVAKKA